mmetsp:Transcript_81064/g.252938  ORF Transcript_81064/g.252938 Transcript_81064/m.252938 type:complete len:239 (-) Transcript_81064:2385-3101(-)
MLREVLQDLSLVFILPDLTVAVEEHHVADGDARAELEAPLQACLLQGLHLALRYGHHEMDCALCVVLLKVLDLAASWALGREHGRQRLLVVLRPAPDGQLSDFQRHGPTLLDDADDVVAVLVCGGHDAALEARPPRAHLLHRLAPHVALQVGDDIARRVVWQRGRPPRANPVSTVDEEHGYHGDVPHRLNGLALLVLILHDLVVCGMEDHARDFLQARVDVTRAGGILASLQARSELP